MSTEDIWAISAPEYKKEGQMYSSVEYDDSGEPILIRVAQNQVRMGEFKVNEGVAEYIDDDLTEPDDETVAYVKQLSFIHEVVV